MGSSASSASSGQAVNAGGAEPSTTPTAGAIAVSAAPAAATPTAARSLVGVGETGSAVRITARTLAKRSGGRRSAGRGPPGVVDIGHRVLLFGGGITYVQPYE
ncbi:hypothetical protein GCM10027184_33960 [Saccharothrix stipae]